MVSDVALFDWRMGFYLVNWSSDMALALDFYMDARGLHLNVDLSTNINLPWNEYLLLCTTICGCGFWIDESFQEQWKIFFLLQFLVLSCRICRIICCWLSSQNQSFLFQPLDSQFEFDAISVHHNWCCFIVCFAATTKGGSTNLSFGFVFKLLSMPTHHISANWHFFSALICTDH